MRHLIRAAIHIVILLPIVPGNLQLDDLRSKLTLIMTKWCIATNDHIQTMKTSAVTTDKLIALYQHKMSDTTINDKDKVKVNIIIEDMQKKKVKLTELIINAEHDLIYIKKLYKIK